MFKGSTRTRVLIGLAAVAIIVSACTSTGRRPARQPPASRPAQPAAQHQRIGRGQDLHHRLLERRRRRQRLPRGAALHGQGRGAFVGPGLEDHRDHRNTDAAGQLQDIRDLIAKDVDAIVFNPNDPAALNPALAEATTPASRPSPSTSSSPTRRPTTSTTTRSSTPSSAPSGCSRRWVARAPSTTCAASPAPGPTPTGTPGSRTCSRTTRTSRSCRASTASPPAGTRDRDQAGQRLHRQRPVRHDPGHLDVRHRLGGRRRDQGGGQEVRADRGHRPWLLRQEAPRPDRLPRPGGRCGHQHRRRRRRGRRPGAQAAQRRDHHDRSSSAAPQDRPAGPGRGRQPDRRGQDGAAVLARPVTLPDPTWPLGLTIDGWTTYTPNRPFRPCKGPGE